MAKPRKQTYALSSYLKKIQEKDISNDANVQRNFVWDNCQVSELVVTVLTDDYIPPIILCEEDSSQLRIADGGQRTAALMLFRYGNKKISPAVENPIIHYKKKTIDGNQVMWEDAEFNVKNKSFDQLPDELKKTFDDYQIETVIHEGCDMHKIAKYIKRYNNHIAMNTNQKSFTYLDNYADIVRRMISGKFFIDCSSFTNREKDTGVLERVIVDTVMLSNHFEAWKKQAKSNFSYLNDNSTAEEFEHLSDNLDRLAEVIDDETKTVFNRKDCFIFLALFDKFTQTGLEDIKFNEFLSNFIRKKRYSFRNSDGKLFDEIDQNMRSKTKAEIIAKLNLLTSCMNDFLGIEETEQDINVLDFVCENVDDSINQDDVDLYESCLDDYTIEVDNNTHLLDKCNRPSLVAIVAYAYQNDKDDTIVNWIKYYFEKNSRYISNQRQNYILMRNDFDNYCRKNAA